VLLRDTLSMTDVIKISDDELAQVVGTGDLEEAPAPCASWGSVWRS
jgi:hypothetical protein